MSARKTTDTKIPEYTEEDSGCFSGPIDRLPGDSGEITGEMSAEIKSDDKIVPSVCVESVEFQSDSGVVVLTEELVNCSLDCQTVLLPRVPTTDTKTSKSLPPLSVLLAQDDDGDTQLHIAAVHGCEQAISTLIKVCPDKEWFNVPNDDGQTALHLAVLSENAVVTRMLVIAGASLAVRDKCGETPLHKATILKNLDCIKALLNPLKESPFKKYTTELNQKNYNGQACVHLAAACGSVTMLQSLVHYGADINSRENLGGWTPLHLAAHHAHEAAARWLRARCAGAEPRPRDYARRTPRRLARRHPAMQHLFAGDSSDSDSDDDDDYYEDDGDSLFSKLQDSLNPTLVV